MLPGHVAQLQRLEARERAEAERLEAERIDRADARQDALVWEARQRAVWAGLPWDPAKPFEHWPTPDEQAEQVFARQDAQARAEERAAAKAAGLLHLLPHLLDGPGVYDFAGAESATPGSGLTSPTSPASRSAALKSRIRRALLRMPKRSVHDGHPSFRPGEWIPPNVVSPEERAARIRKVVG
jgi:hypothetical protein